MKVIATDNFCRENRSDRLIADNLTPEAAAQKAKELNEKHGGDQAEDYYWAVPDNYKLYVFDPT